MSYIDWNDVAKKLTASYKRFDWHLDWIETQLKGVKDVHTASRLVTDDLDDQSDFNSAVIMLRKRLNDIFDPFHQGISFTQQNFNTGSSRGFIVEVPTYLQYGDIEDRISAELQYYIQYGNTFTFNYTAASFTHQAKVYLDVLPDAITNTETFSIINFYNRIRGHGMFTGLKRIYLMSTGSQANAMIDFQGGTTMVQTGTIDYDRFGVASDLSSHLATGVNPDTIYTDIQNCATLIYISKKLSGVSMIECGFNDVTPDYSTFGISANGSGETIANVGLAADIVNAGVQTKGSFLSVTNAGKLRIRKDRDYIGAERTMTGAVKPLGLKILCALSADGTPANHSTNKIGTYIEYDGAMSLTQQIVLNAAVNEYNNLNSR
jgi:hypothetical protein